MESGYLLSRENSNRMNDWSVQCNGAPTGFMWEHACTIVRMYLPHRSVHGIPGHVEKDPKRAKDQERDVISLPALDVLVSEQNLRSVSYSYTPDARLMCSTLKF